MRNLIVLACLIAAQLPAQSALSTQQREGKQVFEASCAVGYCHGLDGRAGHGPRLRDKVWSRSYLYQTIAKGIPGSSMPAWEGKLSGEKMASVISYIFTISKEDGADLGKSSSVMASQPVQPAELPGKALFFDLARDRNCGVCHRIGDWGTGIAHASILARSEKAADLLNRIKSQPTGDKNIQVSLQDGEEFCGVPVSDTGGVVRAYDLGGEGPPVLRTIGRDKLLGIKPCPSLNVHAANSRIYSEDELAIISEFLRRN